MKVKLGPVPEDEGKDTDSFKVKRYVLKYTISHGIYRLLVLWKMAGWPILYWENRYVWHQTENDHQRRNDYRQQNGGSE